MSYIEQRTRKTEFDSRWVAGAQHVEVVGAVRLRGLRVCDGGLHEKLLHRVPLLLKRDAVDRQDNVAEMEALSRLRVGGDGDDDAEQVHLGVVQDVDPEPAVLSARDVNACCAPERAQLRSPV